MAARKTPTGIARFEQQFDELERIVARMESAEQTLDASLADYEKGMALCRSLREALAAAEQKVQILAGRDGDEELVAADAIDEPDAD